MHTFATSAHTFAIFPTEDPVGGLFLVRVAHRRSRPAELKTLPRAATTAERSRWLRLATLGSGRSISEQKEPSSQVETLNARRRRHVQPCEV